MEWATEWGQVNFSRTGYVEIQLYLEHLAMDHGNIYHHSFCSFRLQLPMIRKSSESAVWISLKKTQRVSSEIRISWTVWGSLVLTAAKWQTHDGWAGNSCCCERRATVNSVRSGLLVDLYNVLSHCVISSAMLWHCAWLGYWRGKIENTKIEK